MQQYNTRSQRDQRSGPGRIYRKNQSKPYRIKTASPSKTVSSKLLIALIAACLVIVVCVLFLYDTDADGNAGNVQNEPVEPIMIDDFIEQVQSPTLPPPPAMTSGQEQEGDFEIEEIETTLREG